VQVHLFVQCCCISGGKGHDFPSSPGGGGFDCRLCRVVYGHTIEDIFETTTSEMGDDIMGEEQFTTCFAPYDLRSSVFFCNTVGMT
jgi:hypothetical protein